MFTRGFQRGFARGFRRGFGATLAARGDIVPTVLTEDQSTTDGTTFNTASVNLAAGRLYLVATSAAGASVGVPSITGAGATWAQVPGATRTNGAANRRATWSYALPTAAGSEALTITHGASVSSIAWAVIDCGLGAAFQAPLQVATNAAASTTITATLAAFENSKNAHIYAVARIDAEATNPPAAGGWTELVDRTYLTLNGALAVAYAIGDTTADPTWTTAGGTAIVSLEIRSR